MNNALGLDKFIVIPFLIGVIQIVEVRDVL